MKSPRSTQTSERSWTTAVDLNAFMSSMIKDDTICPDREVLDCISRLSVDGAFEKGISSIEGFLSKSVMLPNNAAT